MFLASRHIPRNLWDMSLKAGQVRASPFPVSRDESQRLLGMCHWKQGKPGRHTSGLTGPSLCSPTIKQIDACDHKTAELITNLLMTTYLGMCGMTKGMEVYLLSLCTAVNIFKATPR